MQRWTLHVSVRLVLSYFLFSLSITPALSQSTQPLETTFLEGLAALEKNAFPAAIEQFASIIKHDPTFRHLEKGMAAQWLGQAYLASSDTTQALHAWQRGLDSLAARHSVDATLCDLFARTVFDHRLEEAYPQAAQAYLDLLAHAESFESLQDRQIVERHIAQLLPLLSEANHQRVVPVEQPEETGYLALTPGASRFLTAWWRGQDVIPATTRNERLEEHLARVAKATQRYPFAYHPSGFDDRGAVFVRLGPPPIEEVITYQDSRLLEILSEPNTRVILSSSDMPKNEVWYYPGLDESGLYVFIRRSGRYQLGSTTDLMPQRLAMLGPYRAPLKVVAMIQYLNQTLGEIHPYYASRYAGGVSDILIYRRFNRWRMDTSTLSPSSRLSGVLTNAVREINDDDYNQERDRADFMPQQHTNLFDDLEKLLPVAFRYARFLDLDGTTRTEIFWSHPPATFNEGGGFVTFSALQKTDDFRQRHFSTQRYVPTEAEQRGEAYVYTYAARGDTGRYHLFLQWDQERRTANPEESTSRTQYLNVFKVDSLTALSGNPGALEMSDLVPTLDLEPNEEALSSDTARYAVTPYPLPTLNAAFPVALYFEVYHLTYGPDDQTHYKVSYEIYRREKGTVWRLFRDKEERTTASTTYVGTSRTAKEHIIVDLSETGGEGALKVTVRVTDEVSGQQVERSIDFDYIEP